MPGTPAATPSMPRADGSPGAHVGGTGLPLPLTTFLGREREIDDVTGLLDSGDIRLLTLTGPGGVGKTRLAIEIARRIAPSFADGVRFVPLASIREPDQVISTVARGVGARDRGDRAPLDLLISALHHRHLLLVIDNVEHVLLADPGWPGELLRMSPRLTVLVTSRAPLHISGEHRYEVRPLLVPDDAPALAEGTAIRLFTQRAQAVRPDFALSAANIDTVNEICRRLDGLPLAIELAAARSQALAPATILGNLADRFSLLADGPQDVPPRMRSMRNTIAWSYELLSVPARELFPRLSVFAGGFTLEAVAHVAASPHEPARDVDALDVVSELADHSLVRPASQRDAEGRFEMLETISEFGLERLADAGLVTEARNDHARFFLSLAAAAWHGMKGPDQVEWLDRVEREYANLQAASAWLVAEDRIEDVVDMAMNMSLFRHLRGMSSRVEALYDQVLRHPRIAAPTVSRGKALFLGGSLAHTLGDRERSVRMLTEAADLFHAHGSREDEAAALWVMANSLQTSDHLSDAEAASLECLAIGRDTGDTRIIGAALVSLGGIAMARGDAERATAVLEEAAGVARSAGDGWILAFVYPGLAELALKMGDIDRAATLLQESKVLVDRLGDHLGLLRVQMQRARLATLQADVATAVAHLEVGLSAARAMADSEYIARLQLEIGHAAHAQHAFRRAAGVTGESLALYQAMGQRSGAARALDLLATIAASAGDPNRAAYFLGAADRMRNDIEVARHEGAVGAEDRRAGELARRKLGDARFEEARNAGRAQSRAEIASAVAAFQATVRDPQPPDVTYQGDLTPREREVLRLLADGLSNQELADAMSVSRRTAATHVEHILTKLGLRSRTAAVAWAIRIGLA